MKVTNSKQLGVYLKDARSNMKLSQSKVASKVGIRQDTVSSFEQNPDSTKLETLFKILSALNLELDVKIRNPELSNTDNSALESELNPKQNSITDVNDSKEWKEEW